MFLGASSSALPDAWFEPLREPSSAMCNVATPSKLINRTADQPSTVSQSVDTEATNQRQKDDLDKKIDSFYVSLKSHAKNDDLVKPLTTFLMNYENIKTESHLSSALITFGKGSRNVAALASPTMIPPTNSPRNNGGRPKRILSVGREHNYSGVNSKRSKAPHNLTECVKRNTPLGKH